MSNKENPEVAASNEDILRKYDKESDFRVMTGFGAKLIAAIAITFLYSSSIRRFSACWTL